VLEPLAGFLVRQPFQLDQRPDNVVLDHPSARDFTTSIMVGG
jgi:hypothetical protein